MKKSRQILLFVLVLTAMLALTVLFTSAANYRVENTGATAISCDTLADAVNAVTDGGTITVLTNITSAEPGLIINKPGVTFTVTGGTSPKTLTMGVENETTRNTTAFPIMVKDGSVTFQNLNLAVDWTNAVNTTKALFYLSTNSTSSAAHLTLDTVTTTSNAHAHIVSIQEHLNTHQKNAACYLTVKGNTNLASTGNAIQVLAYKAEIHLESGTMSAGSAAIVQVSSSRNEVSVIIGDDEGNGPTLSAKYAFHGYGVNTNVTVNGGNITTSNFAVFFTSGASGGTVTVNGGSLQSSTHALEIEASGVTLSLLGGSVTSTGGMAIRVTSGKKNTAIAIGGNAIVTGNTNAIGNYGQSTAVTVTGGNIYSLSHAIAYTSSCSGGSITVSGGQIRSFSGMALNLYGAPSLVISGGYIATGEDRSGARNTSSSMDAVRFNAATGTVEEITVTGGQIVNRGSGGNLFLVNDGVKINNNLITVTGGEHEIDAAEGALIYTYVDAVLEFGGTASYEGAYLFKIRNSSTYAELHITGGAITLSEKAFLLLENARGVSELTLTGGTVTAGKDLFVIANAATVTVTGGTFTSNTGKTLAIVCEDKTAEFTVSISGGNFISRGDAAIFAAAASDKAELHITGGTFTLEESDEVKGGAVLRTGAYAFTFNGYFEVSEMNPADVYYASAMAISVTGGTFIDKRTTNNQVFNFTVGTSEITLTNAVLLANLTGNTVVQPYFVKHVDSGLDIMMDASSPRVFYGGAEYYMWTGAPATELSLAPTMEDGASVRFDSDSAGIRFTSFLPQGVLDELERRGYAEGYTLGTLISPAEYVMAAGGFTHEKLATYGTANEITAVVDIPASSSITSTSTGITFTGALVNLNESNYTRSFAAVAYIKIGDSYYYSTYDLYRNATSIAKVAEKALKDIKPNASAPYIYDSLYRAESFSKYTEAEQEILQDFSGITAQLASTPLNGALSTYRIVHTAGTGSIDAAVVNLAADLGITGNTGSNQILVGETGEAETAAALAKITGHGYYIGVIGGKIVIVGTTNLLTVRAMEAFAASYSGTDTSVFEEIVSNVGMLRFNGDASFVFSGKLDGNIPQGYQWGRTNVDIYNLFNKYPYSAEDNSYAVDYPVYAAAEICKRFDKSADVYSVVADHLTVGGFIIYIGTTDSAETRAFLAGKDVDDYGYSIHNGKIVIAAFDDATLRLAVALFLADMEDFACDGEYLIPADYTVEKTATTSHADSGFVTNVTLPELQLSGAVNVGDKALQYFYEGDGVNLAAYNAYCAQLVSEGYVLRQQAEIRGSHFRTYAKGTSMIYVAYNAYSHASSEVIGNGNDTALDTLYSPAIRVIPVVIDGVFNIDPSALMQKSDYTYKTASKVTQVELTAGGSCYIITLEDGSFVVIDGGTSNATDKTNIWNALTALHSAIWGTPSSTNKVRVAAWYLTHSHGDHYGNMRNIINSYAGTGSSARLIVDRIIGNFPSEDESYNVQDPVLYYQYWLGTSSWPKSNGSPIPYVKVHTGQKLYLANLELEVLYTHEDLYPYSLEFFNNSSTVIRININNTSNGTGSIGKASFMVLGDIQYRASRQLRAMYGDYLKSDMVQMAHHGGAGAEYELYYLINATVVYYPCTLSDYNANTMDSHDDLREEVNINLRAYTVWKYIIVAEQYNLTLTFNEELLDDWRDPDLFVAALTDTYGNATVSTGTYIIVDSYDDSMGDNFGDFGDIDAFG